jgi:hypothetical protein
VVVARVGVVGVGVDAWPGARLLLHVVRATHRTAVATPHTPSPLVPHAPASGFGRQGGVCPHHKAFAAQRAMLDRVVRAGDRGAATVPFVAKVVKSSIVNTQYLN